PDALPICFGGGARDLDAVGEAALARRELLSSAAVLVQDPVDGDGRARVEAVGFQPRVVGDEVGVGAALDDEEPRLANLLAFADGVADGEAQGDGDGKDGQAHRLQPNTRACRARMRRWLAALTSTVVEGSDRPFPKGESGCDDCWQPWSCVSPRPPRPT